MGNPEKGKKQSEAHGLLLLEQGTWNKGLHWARQYPRRTVCVCVWVSPGPGTVTESLVGLGRGLCTEQAPKMKLSQGNLDHITAPLGTVVLLGHPASQPVAP